MYWLRYLLKEPYNTLKTPEDREFIKLLMKYGDKPRYTNTQVSFGKYHMEVPDCMSFLYQYKEIFADGSYKFESKTDAPVIIDCGTNIGMSILYFKSLFPNSKITAFEASANIAGLLHKNLERNAIHDVTIIEKAVWTDDEGIWFSNESADSSSMYLGGNKTLVPSKRLADFLSTQSHIDFLKIDIEGAETEVLKDCRHLLGKVQNIFVEFHSYVDHHQTLADTMKVLEENGFRYVIDTMQHRKNPFVNHYYRDNTVMDLQLNIFGYRPKK